MGLTRVAISRPVFMLMVISAMVVLGLVSYGRLNAELYPSINTPIVTVVTAYPGAGPEDVERLITKPIEDSVSGIAGIKTIASSSKEGVSAITITFNDGVNTDSAATDVGRRVSGITSTLPADAEAPSVIKADVGQIPVLYLAYSGDLPLSELYRVAKDVVKPRLETQSGVASVGITGGLQREVQVKVDPRRLWAYNLTIDQVSQALTRENQGVPGGTLEQGRQQTNLRLQGLFQSAEELRELVIASTGNGNVRLGDVAEVTDAYKKVTSRTYLNGREALGVTITKQSDANEIRTVDAVRAEINRINQVLPAGSRIAVISDLSVFTRNSLNGVRTSLVEAVILTGLVLLVFLHSLRSTVIVLFAIPTSLISTFLVMNFLGFTLNLMSMMALVLVVGVLVDDSIVVLENISRHLELDVPPREAALRGRGEIGLAAIAITLVDVVVFTPVAFMSGISGQWFRQFGLVIAAAVLLSLFISFTLTPLLASRWLKSGHERIWFLPWRLFIRGFEAAFDGLRRGYSGLLGWSLRHRWAPPMVAVLSLFGAFALVPLGLVKFEFISQSDSGYFGINVELPPGASLEATEQALRQVERRLAAVPEVEWYLTRSGVASGNTAFEPPGASARFGQIQVVLVDRHHRHRGQSQVIEQISADTRDIPGAAIRVQAQGGGGSSTAPVQVRVTGEDPRTLQALASRVEQTLAEIPGTRDVSNSASLGSPETRLVPDRRRMADAGVTAQQAALALRTAVEGTVPTKLRPEGQDEVDVRLLLDDATRANLGDIGRLPLSSVRDGQLSMVQLGQVTAAAQVAGPTSIDRRNRERVVTIGANLVGSTPLNDVTQPLQAAIARMEAQGAVPTGYSVRLGGQAEDQAESFGSLGLALGLSVVLEYMLLAALYESFVLPFATMFALPVAIVGAFVALALTGNTLNLLSMIGVIVLMGLVGKNGILLVDLTNQLRQHGLSRTEALRRAGPTRFRPIVMTTMALVFGMLPLAAGIEEGSELYMGMATVIIGGMLSSTLLSLVVVPCMYTYFDDFQNLILRAWRWRPFRRQPAVPPTEPPPAEVVPPRVLEEVGSRR